MRIRNIDKYLIRNATVFAGGQLVREDVLVADGCLAQIAPHIGEISDAIVMDAEGKLLTYGLCDLHVHFREPGQEYKETIETGSMAAARGGYTSVCAMPNLTPAPDSAENLAIEQDRIRESAVIQVLPYATLTVGRKGKHPVDMARLKSSAVGFSDDGSGIQSESLMSELMQMAVKEDVVVTAHCEDNSLLNGGYIHDGAYARQHGHRGISSESEWKQLERDLDLALKTGCRYHACHLSTRESIVLVRQYKRWGARVTCETAPHYLTLCDEDLQEDGRFKMNPPLRSANDRAALLEGLLDGTIDVIATDHAPHSSEEKSRGLRESPFGIVGLETAFPVLYTKLVLPGILSLTQLLNLLVTNPRRIFQIGGEMKEGVSADLAIFDLEDAYVIDYHNFVSKGKATPYQGWQVKGKCVFTMYKGKVVFDDFLFK